MSRIALLLGLFSVLIFSNAWANGEDSAGHVSGTTDAGPSIITYIGAETEFRGNASSPDSEIVKYTWDYDGDGVVDYESSTSGFATHSFGKADTYTAIFRAFTVSGELPADTVKVIVKENEKMAVQELRVSQTKDSAMKASGFSPISADGYSRRYVILINGADYSRFWDDARYAYEMFHNTYGIPGGDIYFFNYDGHAPDGTNPNNIIDYAATKSNMETVINTLSNTIDGDDRLFVWVTGDGYGYIGPVQPYESQSYLYGFLGGTASVDPGDEQDYLESDFKLRSLFIGGMYPGNHGMEVWKTYKQFKNLDETYYYRTKYVSHFDDVYFEQGGLQSDNDIYIERFMDFLAGDYNRDGIINTAIGEVMDIDGDGNPPYNPSTGIFDEDDWGSIDLYYDDYNFINTGVPEGFRTTYRILDIGLDNLLDIDLNHDPANPESNGTDLDNQGLFDGLDVNDDKDFSDWVSIDESIMMLYGSDTITDDDMNEYLSTINAGAIVFVSATCFSGGFVEDLSAPNRIIISNAQEETQSFTSRFIRNITSALSGLTYPDSAGDPALADANQDGKVDMAEAFNFAAANDWGSTIEIPQYDDNGDAVSHAYPVPNGDDGAFGSTITLVAQPDSTAPSTPQVADQGNFTSSMTQITASAVANDPETGIAEYQYQIIQDSPVGTVIRDWTSAGETGSIDASGLSLGHGNIYFFAVKASNGEGLWSATGYSDGITVDTTPPLFPTVTDTGQYTSSTSQLNAACSSSDTDSGIVEYLYKISEGSPAGTVIVDWTSNGANTDISASGLSLSNGSIYFFSVMAINGAGLISVVGSSDGIMVENTPPVTPVVTDEGKTTKSKTTLSASWTSNDPQSGIVEYQYRINMNSPTGTIIRDWTSAGTASGVTATGLSLIANKVYYFSVKALNGATQWSSEGYSDGIRVIK